MADINELNWDDVRIFLATMRADSLRQAAQNLGVSRPTAGRRLTALEQRLGLQLFERRPDGLHATPQAVSLSAAAEEVERSMFALGRVAQASNPELSGRVRVTLPGIVGTELLMDDFMAFCKRWPQIDLELDASYSVASLAEREADVAIRWMPHGKAPDENLAGRLVITAYEATYGDADNWIGLFGGQRDAAWIADSAFPDAPVRGQIFDGALLRSAAAAGLGMVTLPCFFADGHLPRRTEPKPGYDVWVLVHPDLRRNPRLRTFRDFVVEALKSHRAKLEGKVDSVG